MNTSASSSSMDPILARYINLKRQMDTNGSTAGAAAGNGTSRSNSVSNAASAAHHHSYALPPTAGLGSGAAASYDAMQSAAARYGTPNSRTGGSRIGGGGGASSSLNMSAAGFGVGVSAAGASSSTPIASSYAAYTGGAASSAPAYHNASMSSAAAPNHNTHYDARAILQSPKASVGVGNMVGCDASGAISPSLKRRLAARAEAESHLMTAQVAEARRTAADVEVYENRMALKQQQLELDDALGKLEASERQLRSTRDALERAEEVRGELELQLTSAMRDVEVARNNAKTQGQSTAKVLEGKIAALQSEVLHREDELKAAAVRQSTMEAELRRRDQQIDQLTAGLYSKEKAAGETSLASEALKSEVNRLKKALEDTAVELRLRSDRFDQQEAAGRDREMLMEKAAMSAKDEIRALNRKLSQLDVDHCTATEQLREYESANGRLEAEVRELRESVEASEVSHRDTNTKLEAMRARSAQDSILVDQTRFDIEQSRQTINLLRREVSEKDLKMAELEVLCARGEDDHRARIALEAQVAALNTQMDRMREDADHSRRRIEEGQRRADALAREADTIPHLNEKINEMQALVEAKNAALEKQRQVEQNMRDDVNAASTEVKILTDHKAQLTAENQRLDAELKSKNVQIDDLSEEVKKKNALYGEIEGLGAMLRDRDQRIASLVSDVQKWQMKARELDEDIDTLLDVKRQFDDLVTNHRALYAQLEDRNRAFEALQQSSDELAMQLSLKDQEGREYNALLLESDGKVQRLTQQVADKAAVESRLRQTSSELTSVRSELATEKEKREEARLKIHQRDEQLLLERGSRQDAEERANRLQEELADVQVQLGKATVRLEAFDKECRRLTTEGEVKAKQLEGLQEELAIARKDLQQATSDVKEMRFRDTHAAQRIEQLSADLTRYESANSELTNNARIGEERGIICDRLTEKVRALEYQSQTLEARLQDTNAELKERTQQLAENKATIGRLQNDIVTYEKTNQRLTEAKLLMDKQVMVVDSLEKEDAAKSRQLMEKERELSRLREKVTLLTADMETERNRKRSLENRVKDLERECERASTLDGQVAGLNMVVQQRSRALEEEQATSKELRARLSRLSEHNRAASSRAGSVAGSGGGAADPNGIESRIAVKDEIIRQLEQEEKRRQAVIEDLRDQLSETEERLHAAEDALREARNQLAAVDSQWSVKYSKLEAAADRSVAEASSRADPHVVGRLEGELKDARKKAAVLGEELREKERDLRAARSELSMLPDQRDVARRNESLMVEAQQAAREKELELALARAEERRASNLQQQLVGLHLSTATATASTTTPPMGPSLIAAANPAAVSVEDELTQWRESRRAARSTVTANNAAATTVSSSYPDSAAGIEPTLSGGGGGVRYIPSANLSPIRFDESPSPSAGGMGHTLHSPRHDL